MELHHAGSTSSLLGYFGYETKEIGLDEPETKIWSWNKNFIWSDFSELFVAGRNFYRVAVAGRNFYRPRPNFAFKKCSFWDMFMRQYMSDFMRWGPECWCVGKPKTRPFLRTVNRCGISHRFWYRIENMVHTAKGTVLEEFHSVLFHILCMRLKTTRNNEFFTCRRESWCVG